MFYYLYSAKFQICNKLLLAFTEISLFELYTRFFLLKILGFLNNFQLFLHSESYHAAKLADKEDSNKPTLSAACSEGCYFELRAR